MALFNLKRRSRTGSVYMMVLASSMIIAVVGMASLLAVRVQRRSAHLAIEMTEASILSESAVQLGLLFVSNNPNWRGTWSNGTWISNQAFGGGTYSLVGTDPLDADIADSQHDPIILTGIGTKGIARNKTQVTLVPVISPLEALNTCLHTSGLLKVTAGNLITAVGAPVSTNGILDNDEIIDGNADANSAETMKTITGTLTVPAAHKPMPDPNVISDYISRATVVPYTGTIEKQVLTPLCNPWGDANADGVYFIDTLGSDLTIKNVRIHGTLIVRTGTKKLTLDDGICMSNYRSDFPVLVVDGNAEIRFNTSDYALSEVSTGTNYNPPGAPYEGQSDDDMLDEYPNEIRGLIHVKSFLRLADTARFCGTIICEGSVECAGKNTIIHDSGLYACPPEGYTFVDGMRISTGSWKKVVD